MYKPRKAWFWGNLLIVLIVSLVSSDGWAADQASAQHSTEILSCPEEGYTEPLFDQERQSEPEEQSELIYTRGLLCFREALTRQEGRTEKLERARTLFEQAAQKEHPYYLATYYLGVTYGQLANDEKDENKKKDYYSKAESELNKALGLIMAKAEAVRKEPKEIPGFAPLHQDLAVTYYHLGRYPEALSHLETAEEASTPTRFTAYYKGLAHYRRGDYAAASAAFEKAVALEQQGGGPHRDASKEDPPKIAARAQYQRGLAHLAPQQQELDKAKTALQQTLHIASSSPSPSDIALVNDTRDLLNRIEERERRWEIRMGVGSEFDSNVILEPTGGGPAFRQISHKEDFRFVFSFGASVDLLPKASSFRITPSYDFYQNVYTDLSDFELQAHFLKLTTQKSWRVSFLSATDLFLGLEGGANFYRLGQKDYLHELYAMPFLGMFWGNAEQPSGYTSLSYRVTNENYRVSFFDPSRDGWLREVSFRHYFLPFGKKFESCTRQYFLVKAADRGICAFVGYDYSRDNPSLRLGNDFQYNGHGAEVGAHIPLSLFSSAVPVISTSMFDLFYSFRNQDYSFPNSRSGLRPIPLVVNARVNESPRFARARDDDAHNIVATWRVPFTLLRERQFPLLEFKASYYWTFNRSNVSVFQYHRHVGAIGFEVVF